MDWQEVAAIAIVVGVCLAWVYRLACRPHTEGAKLRTRCHGCVVASSSPPPSFVLHARKGQRPVMLLKSK